MGKIVRHKRDGCKSQTITGAGASGAKRDISCRGKEKSYIREPPQMRFQRRKMGIVMTTRDNGWHDQALKGHNAG